MAVIFLDETLAPLQWLAIGLAAIGTISFMWPERLPDRKIVWDKGIFIVLLAAILGGFASLLYKMGDILYPGLYEFRRRSVLWRPDRLVHCVAGATNLYASAPLGRTETLCRKTRAGVDYDRGASRPSTLLSSWLIFKMPLTTYSMLEVLTIPAAWVISHFHYRERMPLHNLAGAACIVLAVIVYLL